MKNKISVPGHSIENEVTSEELTTIAKLFTGAAPGFIKDRIGILSDNARINRIKNFFKVVHQANKELKELGIKIRPLPLKESVQFIEAVSIEENETLQGLYTKLLVNSNIDARNTIVFISIVKELTPEDAKVLQYFYNVITERDIKYPSLFKWGIADKVFSGNNEEANISFDNLMRQRLLNHPQARQTFNGLEIEQAEKSLQPTPLGYAFIVASNRVKKDSEDR